MQKAKQVRWSERDRWASKEDERSLSGPATDWKIPVEYRIPNDWIAELSDAGSVDRGESAQGRARGRLVRGMAGRRWPLSGAYRKDAVMKLSRQRRKGG